MSTTQSRPSSAPGPAWQAMAVLLAAGLGVNGAMMLLAPSTWYALLPGVSDTGPLNAHFVRDIGAAYLAAALAAGLGARFADRRALWPAVLFLGLHAATHLVDSVAGSHSHGAALITELGGVYLPAIGALALALPLRVRVAVPQALVLNRIAATERQLGVPLDYMREMAKLGSPVLFRLGRLAALNRGGDMDDVPAGLLQFAVLGAVMADDCGECVQIHVNLARAAGSDPALLQAAVDGRIDGLPAELALAWRFGQAVAANDSTMEDFRAQVEAICGRRAMVEIGYAIGMGRFYPTLKRALGYARSCSLVQVRAA